MGPRPGGAPRSPAGAELLFHPTVYSMYGETGWEAVLRAHAIDNCVYICTVNHGIGDGEPWMPGMSLGRSGVIGPDGLNPSEPVDGRGSPFDHSAGAT